MADVKEIAQLIAPNNAGPHVVKHVLVDVDRDVVEVVLTCVLQIANCSVKALVILAVHPVQVSVQVLVRVYVVMPVVAVVTERHEFSNGYKRT